MDNSTAAAIVGDHNVVNQTQTHSYVHISPAQLDRPLTKLRAKFPDRVFIETAPRDIQNAMKGKTRLRADMTFQELYSGKWILAEGQITNIWHTVGRPGEGLTVRVEVEPPGSMRSVMLRFNDLWTPRLNHLDKGDKIQAFGRLDSADEWDVVLGDSELLD